MGSFMPVFLAFLLNSFGVYIFREPKNGCGPLFSSLIFLFALFILLWDIRLYPTSLRKLSSFGQFFIEFIISLFLFEHIMNDFWWPLEECLIKFMPRLADYEEEVLKQSGWDGQGMLQFLKTEVAGAIISYIVSLYFLLAVLHATRIIDFRLFSRCGPRVFFKDIIHRVKKLIRHILQVLGIKGKKKVRFCRKSKRPAQKWCGKRVAACDDYHAPDSDDECRHLYDCCNIDRCSD